MRGEGFWINSKSGLFHSVDDHHIWIIREGNAERIGLSKKFRDRLSCTKIRNDRLSSLLTAMEGGLIRVRDHIQFMTFEFSIPTNKALKAIKKSLQETGQAGANKLLRIHNLKTLEGIEIMQKKVIDQFCSIEFLNVPFRAKKILP